MGLDYNKIDDVVIENIDYDDSPEMINENDIFVRVMTI